MDNLIVLNEIADWLGGLEEVPLIFAAYQRSRSLNAPTPYLGLVYQDSNSCSWWEFGERRWEFPAHHLALICTAAGSRSAEPAVGGGIWLATLDIRTYPRYSHLVDEFEFQPIPVINPAAVTAAFRKVSNVFLQRSPSRALRVKAAYLEMLATALDELSAAKNTAGPMPPAMATALRYLHHHYRDPHLSLPQVAAAAGLSVPHFGREFRRCLGQSPMHYVQELRLQQSRALLETTELGIAEVAREVGIDDPLYFSRLFRRRLGRSPRAYRRQRPGEEMSG